MATSKGKKRKKSQQAQRRQQHAKAHDRTREAQRQHLPKAGTSEDNEYLLRRSREDLVDFGMTKAKGPFNWVIIAVILVLLGAGVFGLFILTTR